MYVRPFSELQSLWMFPYLQAAAVLLRIALQTGSPPVRPCRLMRMMKEQGMTERRQREDCTEEKKDKTVSPAITRVTESTVFAFDLIGFIRNRKSAVFALDLEKNDERYSASDQHERSEDRDKAPE